MKRKEQQAKPIEQAQLVTLLELHLVSELRLVEAEEGVFELHVQDHQGNVLALATKRAAKEARQFKKADAALSFIKNHCDNTAAPPKVAVMLRKAVPSRRPRE